MVENRNNRLLNAKLNKYIVPGIMMSLALQLGNIVDTIFVSNLIGVEAMSAVTMSLPVETIVQLTGYCLGVGGSIAAGNMLGKRDKEGASKLFSATFIVTLVVGLLFSLIAFPAASPDIFGAVPVCLFLFSECRCLRSQSGYVPAVPLPI